MSEPGRSPHSGPPTASSGRAVFDATFPHRVKALLRTRPLAGAGERQNWADQRYDLSTLALAAIDAIIARQGFDDELTYDQAAAVLTGLAAASHPHRDPVEHEQVASFVLDTLLNRREREAPFRYRVSDFSLDAGEQVAHRALTLEFRLVTEHEDGARDVVVLRASADAINALVGGLEFDVEDEQAANDLMLTRQLERGAFGQAERAAERNRALSVRYAEEIRTLLADTIRDIRTVAGRWSAEVPAMLTRNREHLDERLNSEHKLLEHVRTALDSADADLEVTRTAARIATVLEECRQRHTELHGRLVRARGVFLDEQTRQQFRPLGNLGNPDVADGVLLALLRAPRKLAQEPAELFAQLTAGPQLCKVVRLGDLLDDLLAPRREPAMDDDEGIVEEIGPDDPPAVPPEVLEHAAVVVETTGLPARLSQLLTTARRIPVPDGLAGADIERVLVLATLWSYAPEAVSETATAIDAAARILGSSAAVDADGTELTVPGWAGDDLLVAADEHSLYLLATESDPTHTADPGADSDPGESR